MPAEQLGLINDSHTSTKFTSTYEGLKMLLFPFPLIDRGLFIALLGCECWLLGCVGSITGFCWLMRRRGRLSLMK